MKITQSFFSPASLSQFQHKIITFIDLLEQMYLAAYCLFPSIKNQQQQQQKSLRENWGIFNTAVCLVMEPAVNLQMD